LKTPTRCLPRSNPGAPSTGALSSTSDCVRSGRAAQARHQRAKNSHLPPGRSESVVRGSIKAHRPRRLGTNGRGTRPSLPGRSESVVRGSIKAHRPRRPGTNGRGTRPSRRAEASPLCAVPEKKNRFARRLIRPGHTAGSPRLCPVSSSWRRQSNTSGRKSPPIRTRRLPPWILRNPSPNVPPRFPLTALFSTKLECDSPVPPSHHSQPRDCALR
jgi:hypothetical protein